MRIVRFDESRDQLRRIDGQPQAAQSPPQRRMPRLEVPFRQLPKFSRWIIREDARAEIEQIDPPIEPSAAGLGNAMSSLGQDGDDPMLFAEAVENLRGFAKFDLAKTDAQSRSQAHGGIIPTDIEHD